MIFSSVVGFFSAGFISAVGFLVAAALLSHQRPLLLHNANSLLSFLPTTGFLPATSFSSDLASSTAAVLSNQNFWFLAWWRILIPRTVFACVFSFSMFRRFFSGFFRILRRIFLRGAQRALWISGLFKILRRSVLSILCMGDCSYSRRRKLYANCHTRHLTCRKPIQSKCRNGPQGARCKTFCLLTLSKEFLGCFWRLWWSHCPHHRWYKVPCAGYDDGFPYCSCQLSLAERHRPFWHHSRPYVS